MNIFATAPNGLRVEGIGKVSISDKDELNILVSSDQKEQKYSIKLSYKNEVQLETPKFSLLEGTYIGNQMVEITSTIINAEIRYTLDGTSPSKSSSLYTSPIKIENTTTLKAILISNGIPSEVNSARYTINKVSSIILNINKNEILADGLDYAIIDYQVLDQNNNNIYSNGSDDEDENREDEGREERMTRKSNGDR